MSQKMNYEFVKESAELNVGKYEAFLVEPAGQELKLALPDATKLDGRSFSVTIIGLKAAGSLVTLYAQDGQSIAGASSRMVLYDSPRRFLAAAGNWHAIA